MVVAIMTAQKSVDIEICPEDVEIILPFDASARTANGTPQRRDTSSKKLLNGISRKRKLESIDENDDSSNSSVDGFSEEPMEKKKKNELFTKGDVEGKMLFPLTPTTPRNKVPVCSSANKTGSYSAAKPCTPKNKTPSSARKTVATPTSTSKRKRNLDMEFASTEKQVRTPSSRPVVAAPNTPYPLRASLRQKIRKTYQEQMEESGDSGSEFSGGESDSDSDDKSSDDSSADEVQTWQKEIRKPIIPLRVAPVRRAAKEMINYVCSPKDYFHLKGLKKSEKTSDNILNQLKNPNLSHSQFRSILKKITLSHEDSVLGMHEHLRSEFRRWMFLLSQNYSVILYGLGSKKNILETFRNEMLSESKVLFVNGFFPSITLKEIVDSIAKELLYIKESAANSSITIDMIQKKLDGSKSINHIFIIINNIEGSCLRDDKCQNAISLLASHKKIHLIASIDHLNAPLVWDVAKLGNLSPVWIDATTFLPYIDEVSFENSFLIKHTGSTMALSSLVNVYKSLTTNAKKVYCLLVEDHLENSKNKNYSGMAFRKLYNAAKHDFMVSSDLALQTLLREFLDHELVKWTKDNERLTIPVETSVLQKFMNSHNESS